MEYKKTSWSNLFIVHVLQGLNTILYTIIKMTADFKETI